MYRCNSLFADLLNNTRLLSEVISLSDGYMPLSVQGKTITVPSVRLYDKLTASPLKQLVSDSLSRINNLDGKSYFHKKKLTLTL